MKFQSQCGLQVFRSVWWLAQKQIPGLLLFPTLELNLALFVMMGLSTSSVLVLAEPCSSQLARGMATTLLSLGLGTLLLLRFAFWRLQLPCKTGLAPTHGYSAVVLGESVVGVSETDPSRSGNPWVRHRDTLDDKIPSFVSYDCMHEDGRGIPFHEASAWRRQCAVLFRGNTSIGEWKVEAEVRTSPFFRCFTPEHRHLYVNDGLRKTVEALVLVGFAHLEGGGAAQIACMWGITTIWAYVVSTRVPAYVLLRNQRILVVQSYGRALVFSILGVNYLVDSSNMEASTPIVLLVQATALLEAVVFHIHMSLVLCCMGCRGLFYVFCRQRRMMRIRKRGWQEDHGERESISVMNEVRGDEPNEGRAGGEEDSGTGIELRGT